MSTYVRPCRTVRNRFPSQEQIDAMKEWIHKPMSARVECIVSAVTGSITFILFFTLYMLSH